MVVLYNMSVAGVRVVEFGPKGLMIAVLVWCTTGPVVRYRVQQITAYHAAASPAHSNELPLLKL